MSENQYDAPAMEVVEFDKEDIACNISGDSGIGKDQWPDGGGC